MMSGCLSFSLCSREYFCVPCDLALELWKLQILEVWKTHCITVLLCTVMITLRVTYNMHVNVLV